jgi:hypothetical protein
MLGHSKVGPRHKTITTPTVQDHKVRIQQPAPARTPTREEERVSGWTWNGVWSCVWIWLHAKLATPFGGANTGRGEPMRKPVRRTAKCVVSSAPPADVCECGCRHLNVPPTWRDDVKRWMVTCVFCWFLFLHFLYCKKQICQVMYPFIQRYFDVDLNDSPFETILASYSRSFGTFIKNMALVLQKCFGSPFDWFCGFFFYANVVCFVNSHRSTLLLDGMRRVTIACYVFIVVSVVYVVRSLWLTGTYITAATM